MTATYGLAIMVTENSSHKALDYGSAIEQIQAELRWVALRLRIIVERQRQRRSVGPPAEYRGLYITDEEVDDFLSSAASDVVVDQLVEEAVSLRQQLDERACAADAQTLPLERTVRDFGLGAAERSVLVVALAPYLDSAYEKVYAYANDDITKRWPTVGLTAEVLEDDPTAGWLCGRCFTGTRRCCATT